MESKERERENTISLGEHTAGTAETKEGDTGTATEEEEYVSDFSLYAAPVVELVVRVLADYEKRDESEMSIHEGELIQVIRQDSSGWWEGKREGEEEVGWFPSSYGEAYHEMWSIEETEDGDEGGHAF